MTAGAHCPATWTTLRTCALDDDLLRVAPASCPDGYSRHPQYDNMCYGLTSLGTLKRAKASSHCNSDGGSLAFVYNHNIHTFVARLMQDVSGSSVFVGLSDEGTEGEYVWDDSEAVGWAKWAPNEPTDGNTNGLDCVVYEEVGAEWLLSPRNCNGNGYGLCQYIIDDGTAKTVALLDGTVGSGRLDLYDGNRWGALCDSDPSSLIIKYVCRELGLDEGSLLDNSGYAEGTGPAMEITMTCSGLFGCLGALARGEDLWTVQEAACDSSNEVAMRCEGADEPTTTSAPLEITTVVETSSTGADEPTTTSAPLEITSVAETSSTGVDEPTTTSAPLEITSDVETLSTGADKPTTASAAVDITLIAETSSIVAEELTSTSSPHQETSVHPTTVSKEPENTSSVQNSGVTETPMNEMPTTASSTPSDNTVCLCKCKEAIGLTLDTGNDLPEITYKKKDVAKYSTATRYDGRPSAIALGGLGGCYSSYDFRFHRCLRLTNPWTRTGSAEIKY
ncbi:hypothetical protein ScPMuIL_001054 [Solemya velum]